jgi:aminoglycoside phosphotransferase (APT) family kinase protein
VSASALDQAGPLRQEDALPVADLAAWLADAIPGLTGTPEVAQYAGGASNRTYLLSFPERELVVRTPPAGRKAASSHDMGREARVMAALQGRFPVPAVLAECRDEGVIGQPFYVMERVRGVILRGDPPPGLTIGPQLAGDLADRTTDLLVALHALDPAALGLTDLDRGPGYVQRQVTGWSDRYRAARLPDSPDGEAVMAWLAEHQPADVRRCLIHNDWRLDNILLDPADLLQVRAVLDWEMATIGDPLMDLGSALAYWVQPDDDPIFQAFRRQPSHLPGMPTRAEVVQRYCSGAGIALGADGFRFYEIFGLFRLAVIAQQIYYRFAQGQTHNPALAGFGAAVAQLIARCERHAAR